MFEVLLNELPILLSADDVEAEASKLYAALASLNVEKLLVKFAISTFQKKHPKIRLKTVVEFNDMWAIGNYGISNDLYVRMLKERYFDIIKNKK